MKTLLNILLLVTVVSVLIGFGLGTLFYIFSTL
jgi:hypothetical protein